MTKKERTGRQIIRETLRITWLVQAGAYTLMQRLNELYAATGQVGFRVTQRVDGRLVQSEGLKCLAMKSA